VGEQTIGGAHPGASYRLHPHFEAFLPVGRAINPHTGEDWEGVGVQPDVPVPVEQALEVAYKLALEGVIENLSETKAESLKPLLEEVQAALNELKGIENE
jgi:C-terminal processing protease CtpA/Prc